MVRALSLFGFLVAAGVGTIALAGGCSSSSSPSSTVDGGQSSSNTSGKSSSTTTSGSKSTSTTTTSTTSTTTTTTSTKIKDSGVEDSPKAMTDGGACSEGTLYTRLGGHAGIRAAVDAVVAKELMNADIASYFFYQTTGAAPKDGHPSADQIEECFTYLVGSAAGGPEKYPTTLSNGEKYDGGGYDGGTYTCRDVALAHKALQINPGTFAEFITIAAGVLEGAGVCPNDLLQLGKALDSFADDVVTLPNDAGAEPFPGSVDAALHVAPDAG